MKHVLLSFFLITAAFSATTTVDFTRALNLEGAIPLETGIPPSRSDLREVHAVVVDMPQRASLKFASPDTWGALPTFDPPEEESPTKSVLQVALN